MCTRFVSYIICARVNVRIQLKRIWPHLISRGVRPNLYMTWVHIQRFEMRLILYFDVWHSHPIWYVHMYICVYTIYVQRICDSSYIQMREIQIIFDISTCTCTYICRQERRLILYRDAWNSYHIWYKHIYKDFTWASCPIWYKHMWRYAHV